MAWSFIYRIESMCSICLFWFQILHTFAYDGSFFYFGAGASRSSNQYSVYRGDLSYDSTTNPINENFLSTVTGVNYICDIVYFLS